MQALFHFLGMKEVSTLIGGKMKKNLHRSEVDPLLTWDLSALFHGDEDARAELDRLRKDAEAFSKSYRGKIADAKTAADAIEAYKELQGRVVRVGSYGYLRAATDSTDTASQSIAQEIGMQLAPIETTLQFLSQELREMESAMLEEVKALGDNGAFIDEVLRVKQHALEPAVEDALSSLTPVLEAPYALYNRAKLADMRFPDFTVEGVTHPLSFGLYEGHYENEPDTALRREGFAKFSEGMAKYRHTIAGTLHTQMQKDKILATMRGFDSVIDALLFEQNVSRELYERQLQAIREDLAPVMRRFAGVIQKTYELDQMTYADLLVPLDPAFEPPVSIEDAKKTLLEALAPLGPEYAEILESAFSDRWIDFAENEGKSTGAFCSSPYGAHPYVLISWTATQRETFVLAHELGHAGHFTLAQRRQNILHTRPSMYLVEAPSTMNELFVTEHMLALTDDERMKRWIRSTMISRTYYHNFVTHGIEALFQKKAYDAVDRGESLSADAFDRLFKETLEEFWGDAVTLVPGAEMTWMRQPHYYMGLYPYTYSAGLTLGTAAYRRIKGEGDAAVSDWLNFLKAGSTKDVLGLAALAGVDLSTDQPLQATIQTISELVDAIAD